MEEILVVSKCICLAFPSEEHYEQCMKDAGAFRQFLTTMYSQYPELFPRQMSQGFKFHSFTPFSRKQEGFRMRRIFPCLQSCSGNATILNHSGSKEGKAHCHHLI